MTSFIGYRGCFTNSLAGSDKIYIGPDQDESLRMSTSVDKLCDLQWQSLQVPVQYMDKNWPIHVVACDKAGTSIAVAGAYGLRFLRDTDSMYT